MLEKGQIVKIEKGLVIVEFLFSHICQKCGLCRRSNAENCQIEVDNSIAAGVGDLVEVEISPGAKMFFPLIVFGLPIILFFIGLSLGNIMSEVGGVALAVLFLLGSFFLVKFIDKMLTIKMGLQGKVVRRVNNGESGNGD